MAKHATAGKRPSSAPSHGHPAAGSVDRMPDPTPTPADETPHISPEDEPRGHPNSDRFQSEQAHRGTERKAGGKA